VSPPDDATDGLLAEASAFARHGTEDLPGPYAHASSKGPWPDIFRDAAPSVSGWMIIFARELS
jgi:hypothetical protein